MNVSEWSDQELVDEILDADSGLSEWEIGFADSCWQQLRSSGTLSEKQRAKARQICERLQKGSS